MISYSIANSSGLPTLNNKTITINNISPGNYRVEFWNTCNSATICNSWNNHTLGDIISQTTQNISTNNPALTIPNFSRDIALKIYSSSPVCFGSNNTIDADDTKAWAINYLSSLFDTNSDGLNNSFEFGYLVNYWGENCN